MEEVPFEDRDVPRVEIDWERSAWWWYPVTRAIAPAVRMNALAVSLIALLLSMAGLQLGERLFSPAWQPNWTVDSLSAATATYTPASSIGAWPCYSPCCRSNAWGGENLVS
ncbi:MAG: hypothetical protein R3C56_31245 [Pirellulaceae bacterium]